MSTPKDSSLPAAQPAAGLGTRPRGGGLTKERELLLRLGIEVVTSGAESEVRHACLRAAHKLQRTGQASIGLLPASANVGVVWAGVNLAVALAELSGSTVAYVDANLRWPALSRDLPEEGPVTEDATDPGATAPYRTRWLSGDVAILLPRHPATMTAGLGVLSEVLLASRELFARSLVDLTGWKRRGEHLAAFALLDGVVVVAQAGLTTEDELLRLSHEIPPERHLGVLLLGAAPGP